MKRKQKTKTVVFGVLGMMAALVASALEAPAYHQGHIPAVVNVTCEDHGETIDLSFTKFTFFDRAGKLHTIQLASGTVEGTSVHGTFTEHPMQAGTRLAGEFGIDAHMINMEIGDTKTVDAHLITSGINENSFTGLFGSILVKDSNGGENEYLVGCKLVSSANH